MEEIDKKIDEMLRQLIEMEAKLQGYKVMIAFEKEKQPKKKKTIVFDFDGVIHTGYEGWKDGTIYGEIDDDLLDYIHKLQKDYYIVISSNRPAQQIVDFMNEYCDGANKCIPLVFDVFNKDMEDNMYWTRDYAIGVTNQKPVGVIYIDDRGYRYRGLEDLKEYIDVVGVDLI